MLYLITFCWFQFVAVAALAASAHAGGLAHGGYGLGLANGGYSYGAVAAAPAVAVHSVPSVEYRVGVAHKPVVSTSVSYAPAVVSRPVLAKVATSSVTTRSDTYTPLYGKALAQVAVAQPTVAVAHAAPAVSYAAPAVTVAHAAPAVSYAAPAVAVAHAAPAVSYGHAAYAAPALSLGHASYAAPALSVSHAAPVAFSAGKW